MKLKLKNIGFEIAEDDLETFKNKLNEFEILIKAIDSIYYLPSYINDKGIKIREVNPNSPYLNKQNIGRN